MEENFNTVATLCTVDKTCQDVNVKMKFNVKRK